MTTTLTTERLTLRPLETDDAEALRALCGDWQVARMLTRVPHPYPEGLAEDWIGTHEAQRAAGSAYHFALAFEGALVGVISLERRETPGVFELGYWLGAPWWGRGLMSEAARAVVAFGLENLQAPRLTSQYFLDNPASGRVLEKCGFEPRGLEEAWSLARQDKVQTRLMVLERAVAP